MTETQDEPGILIVDDHADKLLSLEAVLSDLGRVVRAASGREALRCLLHDQFAVILLDVNMPGMDGFETASIIRGRKSTEHTPIIFITAYGDEMYVSRGYSLGAVDYIQTPVIPDVLRTKVSVFVDLHRKGEQVRMQAERLRQRTKELAALATQVTQAEQRERRRLAQLLHDHLQQLLVAANMRLSLATQCGGEEHATALEQVGSLINKAIDASRSLTTQLSPPILYEGGLVPALEWLGRRMQEDHGLAVLVHADRSAEVVKEDVRAFVFEAVRELLFNIVKHAGVMYANVGVDIPSPGLVRVVVEDAGRGFDASAFRAEAGDGFGLFSIRERLGLFDGRFEILSGEGGGTKITLEVPNPAAAGPGGDTPAGQPALSEHQSPDAAPPDSRGPDAIDGNPRKRVILVDDHEMLRKGLAGLIGSQPDMEVVAEASNGFEAVDRAREVEADVVVMDISMPGMNGVEATRKIVQFSPHLRIIGLSMHEKEHMAKAMREAGAVAYLTKDGPPDALMAAIRGADDAKEAAPAEDPVRVGA